MQYISTILSVLLNDCFQQVIPMAQSILYWNCVIIQFSVIHWFQEIGQLTLFLALIAAILTPTMWFLLLNLILIVRRKSEKALRSWKRIKWEDPQVALYMKQSSRFWRPFDFHFGPFYIIKPIKVMLLFQAIIWGVSKLLFFFE